MEDTRGKGETNGYPPCPTAEEPLTEIGDGLNLEMPRDLIITLADARSEDDRADAVSMSVEGVLVAMFLAKNVLVVDVRTKRV